MGFCCISYPKFNGLKQGFIICDDSECWLSCSADFTRALSWGCVQLETLAGLEGARWLYFHVWKLVTVACGPSILLQMAILPQAKMTFLHGNFMAVFKGAKVGLLKPKLENGMLFLPNSIGRWGNRLHLCGGVWQREPKGFLLLSCLGFFIFSKLVISRFMVSGKFLF